MAGDDVHPAAETEPQPQMPGVPIVPGTEIQQFMLAMQTQMQFFMAQLQHQAQQQIAAQQPVPGHHHGAISHSRLDDRCFRRLEQFSNKNDGRRV